MEISMIIIYGLNNTNYYLYVGQFFWTITSYFSGVPTYGFAVNPSGRLGDYQVFGDYGVRPVINIRSDVQLSGTGTADDPYKIVE